MGSLTRKQRPLIVAVCGDSGSGKTTLTDGMVRVFGQERVVHICLDDYHTLDRATRLRNGITALHPAANNITLMTEHIRLLVHGESIVKPVYDHKTGTFAEPVEFQPADIILCMDFTHFTPKNCATWLTSISILTPKLHCYSSGK